MSLPPIAQRIDGKFMGIARGANLDHSPCSRSGHRAHGESPCRLRAWPSHGHKPQWALGYRYDPLDIVSRLTLFFGVNADHGFTRCLVAVYQLMNLLELLIAMGIAASRLSF